MQNINIICWPPKKLDGFGWGEWPTNGDIWKVNDGWRMVDRMVGHRLWLHWLLIGLPWSQLNCLWQCCVFYLLMGMLGFVGRCRADPSSTKDGCRSTFCTHGRPLVYRCETMAYEGLPLWTATWALRCSWKIVSVRNPCMSGRRMHFVKQDPGNLKGDPHQTPGLVLLWLVIDQVVNLCWWLMIRDTMGYPTTAAQDPFDDATLWASAKGGS